MKHLLFAVHDTKAQAFLPPFSLPALGMAKRTFSDCVNDKQHAFGRHPSDYTLFQIGTYDDETATIFPEKHSLGNGIEYLAPDLGETDLFPRLEHSKSGAQELLGND